MANATKAQQVRTVTEGLALGVLANGVTSVPSGKSDLESALSRAWRRWARAGQFPSIRNSFKPANELWIGITKSENSHAFWGAWAVDKRAYPYLRQENWEAADGLELLAEHDPRVAASDWIELGRLFVEYFDAGVVERN